MARLQAAANIDSQWKQSGILTLERAGTAKREETATTCLSKTS